MNNEKEEVQTAQATNLKSKGQKKDATIMKAQSFAVERVDATPENMLMMAINAGRSMEEIGALIKLRNDELARVAKLEFLEAKRTFQKNCPPLRKTKNADFGPGKTNYWYMDIDDIQNTIKDSLSDAGLSYQWEMKEDGKVITVACILSHTAGHSESVSLSGEADTTGSKNSIQSKASTVSYLRRYTLTGILGISTGARDDDGQGGAKNKPAEVKPFITDAQYAKAMEAIAKGTTTVAKICEKLRLSDEQYINLKAQEDSK